MTPPPSQNKMPNYTPMESKLDSIYNLWSRITTPYQKIKLHALFLSK
jgi:hypothetical protein